MNYKIVIDPGHGGDDPGSSGNGIIEKDLNLLISKYMYDRLNQLGIPVKLTRDKDETISPSDRVDKILSAFGNDPNVIVVSNHINAGGGDGAEVIYALRNNNKLANLILNNLEKNGQNIRDAFQRRLPSDTSKDYYFIHRNTGLTQPVIVEYGFLDSNQDDVSQLKNNYEKYAESVVKALASYTGIPYIAPDGDNYYIVVSGDSLWSIAKKYGTTVDKLKELNNLANNNLSIGQILKLPSDKTKEEVYIVKKGDTLYSISRVTGLTVDEIKKLNNLKTNTLQIGQKITLKGNIDINTNDNYNKYFVKKGDTLYSIARMYGVDQKEIMKVNNLTSNLLSIGQELVIPVNNKIYTVQKGDTLYSIAKKNNITIDELKTKNNLYNNVLSIGQELII